MTGVRTLIVEDEPLARAKLRDIVGGVPWVDCMGEADNGPLAVAMIDTLMPDLVLLDIEMPGCTGLQVLERIAHEPALIFTSAYDRYAVSAFELEALDYLLKPFGTERCVRALDRARRVLGGSIREVPPVLERAPRDGWVGTAVAHLRP